MMRSRETRKPVSTARKSYYRYEQSPLLISINQLQFKHMAIVAPYAYNVEFTRIFRTRAKREKALNVTFHF